MNNYEKAIQLLEKYNQPILKSELEKNKNEKLIQKILSINFEQLELKTFLMMSLKIYIIQTLLLFQKTH